MVQWCRFVAVGDSFTEGLDDPCPDGASFRGWADLVAARLAIQYRASCRPALVNAPLNAQVEAGKPVDRFLYANLAIRGRLFTQIVEGQVPEALRMSPDLISFGAGGNDLLRRNLDVVAMLARLEEVVVAMRATGADVILFSWADVTSRLPKRDRILPRLQVLNDATSEVAAKHGARLVDMWHDNEFHNPRLWSEDRLHLSTTGHRRVAAHALHALGLEPDPSWLSPPIPFERRSWYAARVADARWVRKYYLPWIKRRLIGRSTGDTITAKRPTLMPVTETVASACIPPTV